MDARAPEAPTVELGSVPVLTADPRLPLAVRAGALPARAKQMRVMVADDHPIFRRGVAALLRATADLDLVAEAGSGPDALRLAAELVPEVALVDIAMPALDGLAVIRRAAELGLPTRFAVLSTHEDRGHLRQALNAGARAYLVKRSTRDNLVDALRAVGSGGVYLDPALACRFGRPGAPLALGPAAPCQTLTLREEEVLRLTAFGFTGKEIAARLSIAPKSVECYKARATDKLGLSSRAKIVRYALLSGWLANDPDAV